MNFHSLRHTTLFTALLIGLSGLSACGGDSANDAGDSSSKPATEMLAANIDEVPMTKEQMVDEIARTLQACSYDGSPLKVDASNMVFGVNAGAGEVVSAIMKFTGLPQNFDVVEHPKVPNAAAVIVMGPDKLPRRVIAYNASFMDDVRTATANNNWAPISIMAHEIGHHLSGHTIQPGGSQPPTELEADKFSGYVLYKMGAVLADAQKAMNTLVPETDGATHPGRGKRIRAIEDGWKQACTQQAGNCDGSVAIAAAAPPPAVTAPSTPAEPTAAPTATAPPASTKVDVLPEADDSAIASKFGKFVIDELGVLDPGARAEFEQRMYKHAEQHGVEIVSIIARDLGGRSADEYAYAMMRQLRVGKLDVGNGAVLVVHPSTGETGVALGAGVMLEMRNYIDLEKSRLKGFLDIGLSQCKGVCNADQSEIFFSAAEHIADDTDHWDWQVRFTSLSELMTRYEAELVKRDNGADYDPETDPTWRKITRLEGKLLSRDAGAGALAKRVNSVKVETIGAPLHVRSSDGRDLLVYVDPHVETLMPSKLEEGRSYVFTAREASLSRNPKDPLSFDLLSFDAAP